MTHRHTPRGGSSGPHQPALQGPGLHSEGVQRPEDSAGTGSHESAGLRGRCGGRSPALQLAGHRVEEQHECSPQGLQSLPSPKVCWNNADSSREGDFEVKLLGNGALTLYQPTNYLESGAALRDRLGTKGQIP